jgi:hypothetical protein
VGPTCYTLAPDGRSITCLCCGLTSFHPEDVRQLYCGNCHEFHKEREKEFEYKLPDENRSALRDALNHLVDSHDKSVIDVVLLNIDLLVEKAFLDGATGKT